MDLNKIKKETEEFFKKMDVEAEVKVASSEGSTICIDIKTEKPQILIGERGYTLLEIQRLLKIILCRKISLSGRESKQPAQQIFVNLDINDYKKRKIEYLKELANEQADQVVLNKKEALLPPMPAYERRIIHMELAERKDVITESVGKEPERRIIIKPCF